MSFAPAIIGLTLLCALTGTGARVLRDSLIRQYKAPYQVRNDWHDETYRKNDRQLDGYYQPDQWDSDYDENYDEAYRKSDRHVDGFSFYPRGWWDHEPDEIYYPRDRWNNFPANGPQFFERRGEKKDVWKVYKEIYKNAFEEGKGADKLYSMMQEYSKKPKSAAVKATLEKIDKLSDEGETTTMLEGVLASLSDKELMAMKETASKGLDPKTELGSFKLQVRIMKAMLERKKMTVDKYLDGVVKDLKKGITDDELRTVLKSGGVEV